MLLSFRAAARPFTSVRPAARTPVCIRRVVVRASAEELDAGAPVQTEESTVTDEELSFLIDDEEDDALDAIYDNAVVNDEDEVQDVEELDEAEMQAVLEAADLLADDVDFATDALISAEMGTDEEKASAMNALASFLENADDENPDHADTVSQLASVINVDELEEVEPSDGLPRSGWRKCAFPLEEVSLSVAEQELVAPIKLSKSELRNLLPADWDQINTDFFSSKKNEDIPLPEFRLNLLWNVNTLGVAIDQVYSRGQVSPLTEYFFWPRQDAWEDLRRALEIRPWIAERDRIVLLNRLTQVINYWQEGEAKPPIEDARSVFPDCMFIVA